MSSSCSCSRVLRLERSVDDDPFSAMAFEMFWSFFLLAVMRRRSSRR